MDTVKRYDLIDAIIKEWVENASLDELRAHYCSSQYDLLDTMDDEELLETALENDVDIGDLAWDVLGTN